jgi:hypothetical protein
VIEGPPASLGIEASMTCTNYTRCARTALRATTARAHEKEISFAETVSAQAAPGEGTQ